MPKYHGKRVTLNKPHRVGFRLAAALPFPISYRCAPGHREGREATQVGGVRERWKRQGEEGSVWRPQHADSQIEPGAPEELPRAAPLRRQPRAENVGALLELPGVVDTYRYL